MKEWIMAYKHCFFGSSWLMNLMDQHLVTSISVQDLDPIYVFKFDHVTTTKKKKSNWSCHTSSRKLKGRYKLGWTKTQCWSMARYFLSWHTFIKMPILQPNTESSRPKKKLLLHETLMHKANYNVIFWRPGMRCEKMMKLQLRHVSHQIQVYLIIYRLYQNNILKDGKLVKPTICFR